MPHRVLFIAGVLALAFALPLAAGAHHRPGHGGGGQPPQAGQLSIAANPSVVVYNRSTVISGKLKGNPNANVPIRLQANPHPYTGGFQTVATKPTDANGDYSFSVAPKKNTRYRVVAGTAPPQTSAEILVFVRIRVGLIVSDSTPASGQLVRFSGSALPEHDGKTVYIQRRTSTGSYRTVARTTLRDAGTTRSAFGRRVRVYRDGVFRARVLRDADHATGTSRRRSLNAH